MEFISQLVLLRFVKESSPRGRHKNAFISHITFSSRELLNLHSAENRESSVFDNDKYFQPVPETQFLFLVC